jgi:hypothetical protein
MRRVRPLRVDCRLTTGNDPVRDHHDSSPNSKERAMATDLHREPWNKGIILGQKAPLKLKEVWAIRMRLQLACSRRLTGPFSSITEPTREALTIWIKASALRSDDWLFAGRKDAAHLSTRQYSRIVHRWIVELRGDASAYGTHSIRRTKASLIYRRTKNLRAVQLLLGHTKLESTVRYPGIEVDDALEMAEQTEV